ncbi:ABC transporter ATP-binding protein [Schaalia sp. ZJ1691]|uniref:ABC transporter ATP-binding protein n=1 Tax=Schaalia sp. ZJ1691 TaxID=2709404 RepID=UPI0013ED77B5|nr:ABC transporter ATP-binding protein [Schaalia sp. ZJ1691]
MNTSPFAIDVKDAEKSFGTVHAVRSLSLTIPQGQIVALLGHNGAGKTTLIDMILGLTTPTRGTTHLFGMPPREALRRSLVGAVHQTGGLMNDYTVAQMIHLFAATHHDHLPIADVLAETRLTGLAKRRISKLSGGELQRVRLALALLPNPPLLILDEPTAGMDASARRNFWELMGLQAAHGRTILFATHYLAEAQDFAERTIIMSRGRIVRDGPTNTIRHEAESKTLCITIPDDARQRAEDALVSCALPDGHWQWKPVHDDTKTREPADTSASCSTLTLRARSVDEAVRVLLDIPGAHNLLISEASLEDVFTAIEEEAAQ